MSEGHPGRSESIGPNKRMVPSHGWNGSKYESWRCAHPAPVRAALLDHHSHFMSIFVLKQKKKRRKKKQQHCGTFDGFVVVKFIDQPKEVIKP